MLRRFSSFLAALAAALWAYDGWEDLNRVGSEVQNPQRNFPIAMAGGTILVAGIYLLFSAACIYVLPFQGVAQSQHVGSDVVATFARQRRGAVVYFGDDCFGAGDIEFVAVERGARALCDGARRIIFSRDFERASAISHAERGADFSGNSGQRDGSERHF